MINKEASKMRVGAKIVACCWLLAALFVLFNLILFNNGPDIPGFIFGITLAVIPLVASLAVLYGENWGLWILVGYSFIGIMSNVVGLWNLYTSPPYSGDILPAPDPKEGIYLYIVEIILMLAGLVVLLLSRRKSINSTGKKDQTMLNTQALSRYKSKWIVGVLILVSVAGYFTISALQAKKYENIIKYSVESTTPVSIPQSAIQGVAVSNVDPNRPLTQTNIRIWKTGEQTIRCSDFYEQRISIYVPADSQILSYKTIKATGINAAPMLVSVMQPAGRRIFVVFDYLKPNDGFLVQIIHNGKLTDDWRVVGMIGEFYPMVKVDYDINTVPLALR